MSTFFNPTYDHSYQQYIESQLEPDNIIMGSGKRYKPIPKMPHQLWNEYRNAYIKEHGEEAWLKLCEDNERRNNNDQY
jgi:citrate synthase